MGATGVAQYICLALQAPPRPRSCQPRGSHLPRWYWVVVQGSLGFGDAIVSLPGDLVYLPVLVFVPAGRAINLLDRYSFRGARLRSLAEKHCTANKMHEGGGYIEYPMNFTDY